MSSAALWKKYRPKSTSVPEAGVCVPARSSNRMFFSMRCQPRGRMTIVGRSVSSELRIV